LREKITKNVKKINIFSEKGGEETESGGGKGNCWVLEASTLRSPYSPAGLNPGAYGGAIEETGGKIFFGRNQEGKRGISLIRSR